MGGQSVMFWGKRKDAGRVRGFMSRLAHDVRGNTLIIMTAALIPLAGMVGGGIDLSRMYILKTRMQHGCDSGALAGRKTMGGGTWSYNSYAARTQAEKFFDGNFESGSFGSSGLTRSFTETAGRVTGTATATIPMTLMRIFGRTTDTLTVTCSSEMRLPNTDVMFVLDTTGSMGDTPSGDSQSKMESLKESVKCFYEIVARLDTDANCTTGTPGGGTGNQVQIRFGFVPYATNVNVGKLLPTAYFANTWNYQTREATYNTSTSTTTGAATVSGTSYLSPSYGGWSNDTVINNSTQSQCDATPVPPDTAFTSTGGEGSAQSYNAGSGNPRTATWYTTQSGYYNNYQTSFNTSNDRCRIRIRRVDVTLRRDYAQTTTTGVVTQTFSGWRYNLLPVNIGLLKNGTSWNPNFQWRVGDNATDRTVGWEGCIEERATVKQATYTPIPAAAEDLDIDQVPVSSDANSLWAPVLPDLIFTRENSSNNWTTSEVTRTSSQSQYGNESSYQCPVEAKTLQSWPTASTFDDYVDSLSPGGNTYHDIGLLWGARFASPTGIFAATNAFTPQGGEIERHIIFMTDGDPCTSVGNYTAYGVAWFDRRQTDSSAAPTDGCTDTGTLTAQVNARTDAICSAIKNKNITLWVITFGSLAATTNTRMTACATPGRYFNATDRATLQATFKSIADQISQLRLTQ